MKPKWIALTFFLCMTTWLGHALWRTHVYERGYSAIAQGDSETQVRHLLGPANEITGRPDFVAWDSENSKRVNQGECVRVFWYRPLIFLDAREWTIGFDRDAKVVSKYQCFSR
jgi:hypothetical protein